MSDAERELLKGYVFREGENGTAYIIRDRDGGRFDLGDAFDAIRAQTGWGGVVLLSTTYWTDGVETSWQGADQVRWHFTRY